MKRHRLPEVTNRQLGHDGNNESAVLKGNCSFGNLRVGGRRVECMLDTGAEISCMSETFYNLHFHGMKQLERKLRLTSVDGSGVEYMGYVELYVEADQWWCRAGFLVLKGD